MYLALSMVLLFAAPGLSAQCFEDKDKSSPPDPNAHQNVAFGQQSFALNFLKTYKTSEENVFFSPSSIYNALMLVYFASDKQTEQSIKNLLNLPQSQTKLSMIEAYKVNKKLRNERETNDSMSYELNEGNRVYVANELTVTDCMANLLEDEVQHIDFKSNPTASEAMINSWVEKQTKENIKDLLPHGTVTSMTHLVLVSAIYFKGTWESQFHPQNTITDVFYGNIKNKEKINEVKMMVQTGIFNHVVSEKLGAHILELPYEGDDISLFILLPPYASPIGIPSILNRLTPEAFREIVAPNFLIPLLVEIHIPRFSIEYEVDNLRQVLEQLGAGDLFQPTADLSRLTDKPGLSLDNAVHKAKIVLNEEGTTASASTAFTASRSALISKPIIFKANHPFIYILYDRVSNHILFSGIFAEPTEKVQV